MAYYPYIYTITRIKIPQTKQMQINPIYIYIHTYIYMCVHIHMCKKYQTIIYHHQLYILLIQLYNVLRMILLIQYHIHQMIKVLLCSVIQIIHQSTSQPLGRGSPGDHWALRRAVSEAAWSPHTPQRPADVKRWWLDTRKTIENGCKTINFNRKSWWLTIFL